jgi:DNA-binding XRE family transcriptional regulator
VTDTTAPTLAERHGQLVTAARNTLEIAQQTLAAEAGCSQQTISRIEKGEQATSDALKVRIAAALGQKVSVLFSLDEEGE